MSGVGTRQVFFIGGFDPKGPSSFYQRQRESLAAHSARHGGVYTLGPRVRNSSCSHQWSILASGGAGDVRTQFDYLAWDDLVRQQWARTPAALTRQALGSLRDFVVTGAMQRLYGLSKNVVLAALFPYGMVVAAAVATALAGALAAKTAQALGWPGLWQWVALAAALAATATASYHGLRRLPSTWFMRVVAFARSYAQAHSPDAPLQQRVAAWGQHLCQQLQASPADEVLLVGYSAGSILSTGVLAYVLRHAPAADHARMSLLTLGNCIGVPAALPHATHLLKDLTTIGNAQVRWLDVTSPVDWGSLALCDPVCIFANGQASTQRRFISPQFHLLFCAEKYQQLKKDKYRVHQQYLQTSELLGKYDYFAILCGSMSLHERFFTS
ncbi:MAG: hypothetical protein WB821_08980 [Burkholderiaceae bacterium]